MSGETGLVAESNGSGPVAGAAEEAAKGAVVALKWGGKAHEVSLEGLSTFADLQGRIFTLLDVRPANQKIMGLKTKDGAKASPTAETALEELELGRKTALLMMGQPDHVIEKAQQGPAEETVFSDDLGETATAAGEVSAELRRVFEAKVDRRVREYKVEEGEEALRPNKRLLVLDIDYTFYDHRSEAQSIDVLTRPYIRQLLTALYPHYNIVVWSATGMKWIKAKLKEMGLVGQADWKIAFCLDAYAMISIHTERLGVREVKPLRVVWDKFPELTSPANTVMLDDVGTNFFMNPANGLKIRPYRNAHTAKATDRELLDLSRYLGHIAEAEADFTKLDHSAWRKYLKRLD